ncbi:hypothetical protein [Demequina sp.]|uniref:hypothetical protein n=1 Tax=Demequina sp. TaxID=2050685 RepID=UPI003A876205
MRVLRSATAAACAVAGLAMVAGCAGSGTHAGAGGVWPSGPLEWDAELDLGYPGEQERVVRDVTYYPACGNEVLDFEGTEYFPYTPAGLATFPDPATAAAPLELDGAALGFARASALRAVVAPEEGDDTGTLTIYQGGHAYWVSDNGELDTWLTTTELVYQWVC